MVDQTAQRTPDVLRVVGFVDNREQAPGPLLGSLDTPLRELVEAYHVDEVIIALNDSQYKHLQPMFEELYALPVRVRMVPSYVSVMIYHPSAKNLGELPLITVNNPAMTHYQRMLKRAFDLLVASFIFMLVAPVMVAVAVAIKLDSPGPALFVQPRIGENGRTFNILKFRSMVQNADAMHEQVTTEDEEGNAIHKRPDDFRVTRVGRFIRKASLDELPQLINVIRGDMSLVGPRPELPRIVAQYQSWQRQRFLVPQGVTGWWQVNGRSEKPCHLCTEMDLYYIEHYSFLFDLQILLMTIPALLKGKGAF